MTRDRDLPRDRDIERVLEHWLSDGVNEMPDRVYQSIFDHVERQPQALAPRLLRRLPAMNGSLRWIAAAAAVLFIAMVGFAVLGRQSASNIGTQPTATPSSTLATPTTTVPSPSVGVDVACDLMTATEAVGALHVSSAILVGPPVDKENIGGDGYCLYTAASAGELVVLSYVKEGGVETFATWKTQTGMQPVSGLGDEAVWDPTQTTLFILKGSRLISISAGDGAPPMTLETAKAVGAIVVGRM